MPVRTLTLALSLGLTGAATLSFAQSPQMGTWKLDAARSHIPAGQINDTTITYEPDGDNVKITIDATSENGQPLHTVWIGKFDGKDYPLRGDAEADARAYTKINDHTLAIANKKDGKTVLTARTTVSPNGKTRIMRVNGTNAAGKHVIITAVYDKQ